MKKVEFQHIGDYFSDPEGSQIRITIKRDLKDALLKLDHFSHCVIFTKGNQGFHCYIAKIVDIRQKTGELIIESYNQLKGELVDIKPYFPCEEKVDKYNKEIVVREEDFDPLFFRGEPIGKYFSAHDGGIIQFQESENLSAEAIERVIKHIKEGTFLRVIWWFDRFDDKRYRSCLVCNPPYDNAPKCGVFATRSPVRPNPIASTVVKVKSTDQYNKSITVLGFDGFSDTMILQVIPYQETDISGIKVPKWVEHWTDCKVFYDINKIELCSDDHSNAVYNKATEYFEELECNEIGQETEDLNEIVVEGASIHNLHNINVRIPKEKITVITGVSGSGKSSLAFDTIYYESQKQFLDLISSNTLTGTELKDSRVKKITGLQSSIAIEQKSLGANPRSTVATVTGIGEFLRLLFATIGDRICPNCLKAVPENNVCNFCGAIFLTLTPAVFNYNNPDYMCPVCKGLGEELQADINLIVTNPELSILDGASPWWGNLRKHREKPNANWMKGEVLALAEDMNEDLEVPFKDLSEEFKNQIFYGSNGRMVTWSYVNPNGRSGTITRPVEGVVNILKRLLAENRTSGSIEHIKRFFVNKKCSRCKGERLLEEGRLVKIGDTRYPEAVSMSITTLRNWCHFIYGNLNEINREKCRDILRKIVTRLKKLEEVGLGYITLDRSIPSLSGGEAQRVKLANQLGTGLSNILYIMDEPSKGLHPKDFQFLIPAIRHLKRLRNTVIVVEHRKEFIQMADYLIEIGPGAGNYGGQLLYSGMGEQQMFYDAKNYEYSVKSAAVEEDEKILLKGARTNNLKSIDISIPLKKMVCVIGVSGSGKSSLVSKTLYPAILKALGMSVEVVGEYDSISGIDGISNLYYVSQKPIGKNSRSTPGTYTGVFDLIRNYYAELSEAKKAKLTKEYFSFNSQKGQCEACKGAGEIAIPMHFMQDIYVPCHKCKGKRYKESVLKIKYKGYSIGDLLDLEIREVGEIFKNQPAIYRVLDMLCKVGLSYIKFGQSAATLSGGEAQRIKLAKELCDGKTEGAIYILDEPTSGLHDNDIDKLCYIIRELTSKGATVVIIEHNPRIINQADYIIELGPGGGENGGFLLKEGWI
ncbi:SAM-dependent methyltransferase [Ruminiclostridium herbifermentans]|uniref:UvrABC system protein A n=1 Tax=Ruminiclostridium herbifermentans TaxID=2488810 RepID=A0A4V6EP10_9FIRM|nr:TrmO family methyltransferase [Ruminiclostridium herbifermentans]QNU66208.1 SAM-dependent methyltransferase [Ruminiclostridium herbifermentans]